MEKDKNKEETINENKDKDYSRYADQPEKLFSLAQEKFNINKYEDGLIILDKSINYALKKYGGEEKIEMAQFYNKYADGLIQKLSNSNEEFLNIESDVDKKEKESKLTELSKKKIISEDIEDNKYKKNKEEENEEIKESEDNNETIEEEVAYENLNESNIILKNYLKKFDDKEVKSLDNIDIKYFLELSENYYLLASLEKLNMDFQKADYFYTLSSEILKKYGNKFSRKLAGLYFEQAQILDLNPKKCLLSLFKSKIIMENYLQKEIDQIKLNIKIDIDENDLDLDNVSYDNEKIFKNKDKIENEELVNASKTNSNIKEFLDIIKNINNKLEDVILELKQYDVYLKGKKQIIKDKENLNSLNNNNELNKIDEMTKIALVTKKRKDIFNYKDDIKATEDFISKEKIDNDKIKF